MAEENVRIYSLGSAGLFRNLKTRCCVVVCTVPRQFIKFINLFIKIDRIVKLQI